MNLLESFRLAIEAIGRNRMRSILTMLGIVIGVGAVIGLISLGRGVEGFVSNEFKALGSNLLTIRTKKPESNTRTRIEPLTIRDVDSLEDTSLYPSVQQVGAEYNILGFVVDDGERISLTVKGVTANIGSIRNWKPALGSYVTDENVKNKQRVAVLGLDVVEDLYGDRTIDPVGRVIRINEQPFTVIGVMEERSSAFSNENGTIYVPISTAQTRLNDARIGSTYQVSDIVVQAVSDKSTDDAEHAVDQYFFNEHDVRFDGEQDYGITNQADLLSAVGAVTGLLTVFLSMIASISLVVGGIGIMNIMLVSVTERTREIGLRKAVGAKPRDILTQFLIESIVLSLLGGAIGIALGWSIGALGSVLVPDLPLAVRPDAIILATVVSSFIGIFFGLFPANRAARMNPIDALRFE